LVLNYFSNASEVIHWCEARKEKAGKTCHVWIKEMSESEPCDDAPRSKYMLSKPRHVEVLGTSITGDLTYWLCGNRCRAGMTFIWAYLWNAGSLVTMAKGNIKQNTCKIITNVFQGGGSARSSDEGFVMKLEQRG